MVKAFHHFDAKSEYKWIIKKKRFIITLDQKKICVCLGFRYLPYFFAVKMLTLIYLWSFWLKHRLDFFPIKEILKLVLTYIFSTRDEGCFFSI